MSLLTAKRTPELAEVGCFGPEASKKALIDFVGDLSDHPVFGTNLIVATYIRPIKTKGGIIRPGENVKEDELQGNVGLVLKLGDGLDEDAKEAFLHKWVMFAYNDGLRYILNDVHCRTISIERIRQSPPDPSKVL